MAKKVLVVDDELDMRVFLTTLLETSGFKAVTAKDGREGLETARKHKLALIIMDVMMPKESGIHMYRGLQNDDELRKIPILVISALAKKTFLHSQKLLDDYEGGAVPEPAGYIEKPPEADEVLEAIERILGEQTKSA